MIDFFRLTSYFPIKSLALNNLLHLANMMSVVTMVGEEYDESPGLRDIKSSQLICKTQKPSQ